MITDYKINVCLDWIMTKVYCSSSIINLLKVGLNQNSRLINIRRKIIDSN